MGCTNAIPEVSLLEQPSYTPPALPKVQTADFASADLAAAQNATSVDAYSAKVLVQSGAPAKSIQTSDGYTLENRQLSF